MLDRFRSVLRATAVGAAILGGPVAASAQDAPMAGHVASFIPMTAAAGQAEAFAAYLTRAAGIVRETEPGTVHWFGLLAGNGLAIFDVFTDANARQAHFAGRVAADIRANAARWVAGGWDAGVLPNVSNAEVLSAREPVALGTATTATWIALEAAPGQGDSLADLLRAGGAIVGRTEPGTLFWVALRIDRDRFAIFDVFADEAGRTAHFAGQVAALLQERAPTLVKGGWNNGVVANVRNFTILARR